MRLFVVVGKLKECRAYRDQCIKDQLHRMMSSRASSAAVTPQKERSVVSLYDDGYRSADSHQNSPGNKSRRLADTRLCNYVYIVNVLSYL